MPWIPDSRYWIPKFASETRRLFTWREEDPRRRNNFTLGLHAEILVRVVPKYRRFERELKMAGDKNRHTIWALLFSLLALTLPFRGIIAIISS